MVAPMIVIITMTTYEMTMVVVRGVGTDDDSDDNHVGLLIWADLAYLHLATTNGLAHPDPLNLTGSKL